MQNNTPNLINWKSFMEKMGGMKKTAQAEDPKKEMGQFDSQGNPKLVIDSKGQEFRPRSGLEGPFVGKSGMAYYYDPKQGEYYCPYHDMYTKTPMHDVEKYAFNYESSMEKEAAKKGSKKPRGKQKAKPTNPSLWSRAKSMAKSKFDVYPCVPLDSLAITKTGPQIYENLKIGDEILSYNIEKDELEWNSILNMHYFENAPMVQIGKATGFQVKCTPNHKWVVRRGENYQNTELIETKDLNKHMQLVVCASLENSSELVMEKWAKKDSWIEKILSMSKNEREIFLASAIIYDGHDKGVSTKILNRHSFGFSQKNEDHFYATILAAYLNGYHVTFADKYPDMQSATIIRNKKTHNTQNLIIKNVESEDVWCPETANGTWVMIQNGFLTITGNSAYANGWAARWYKQHGGGWRTTSSKKKKK